MLIDISIHAPLTGSDPHVEMGVRGNWDFNPRSPYGERQIDYLLSMVPMDFNPRSPYGERQLYPELFDTEKRFQSTLPLRGATFYPVFNAIAHVISIHAPLTGSDRTFRMHLSPAPNFNPRSPYGERRYRVSRSITDIRISIHAPLTGSDLLQPLPEPVRPHFNPRSPYGERPPLRDRGTVQPAFQSTLPLRGATC